MPVPAGFQRCRGVRAQPFLHHHRHVSELDRHPPHALGGRTAALRPVLLRILARFKTDYNFAAPLTAWDESSAKAHWRNRAKGQPFFAVFNTNTTYESRIRASAQEFAQLSVAWSPDGKTLASASTDRTIRLWPGNADVLLDQVRHAIRLFSLSREECQRYFQSDSCPPVVTLTPGPK